MKLKSLIPAQFATVLCGLLLNFDISAQSTVTPLVYTDGRITNVVRHGGKVYVAGQFNYMGNSANPYLVLVDSAGNKLNVSKPDGGVNYVVSDNQGGWFIMGDFSRVGTINTGNLAHISANGSVLNWNHGLDGKATGLEVHGGKVYVFGQFTRSNGSVRNKFAVFNINSGQLDSLQLKGLKPNQQFGVIKGYAGNIYLSGGFDTLNGVACKKYAVLDTLNGTVREWSAFTLFPSSLSPLFQFGQGKALIRNTGSGSSLLLADTGTAAIDSAFPFVKSKGISRIEKDGNKILVIGAIDSVGGLPCNIYFVYDLAARAIIVRGDSTFKAWNFPSVARLKDSLIYGATIPNSPTLIDSSNKVWNIYTGQLHPFPLRTNDHIRSISFSQDKLLIGGYFTSSGGQYVRNIIALDASTFQPLQSFSAGTDSAIYKLVPYRDRIFVSGCFSKVNNVTRKYLVALDTTSGSIVNTFSPSSNSIVYDISDCDSTIIVCGSFDSIGGVKRKYLAEVRKSDGSVKALDLQINNFVGTVFYADSMLYLDGAFDTIAGAFAGYDVVAYNIKKNKVMGGPQTKYGNTLSFSIQGSAKKYYKYNNNIYITNGFPHGSQLAFGHQEVPVFVITPDSGHLASIPLPTVGNPFQPPYYPNAANAFVVKNGIMYCGGGFTSPSTQQGLTMRALQLDSNKEMFFTQLFNGNDISAMALSDQHILVAQGNILSSVINWTRQNKISGYVFNDSNANGVRDAGEAGVPFMGVSLNNKLFTTTDTSGYYELYADTGIFTLSASGTFFQQLRYHSMLPAQYSINFTGSYGADTLKNFAMRVLYAAKDLKIKGVGSGARPGFYSGVLLYTRNIGTQPQYHVRLSLTADSLVTNVSYGPVAGNQPDSVVGRTSYWSLDTILPGQSLYYNYWITPKNIRYYLPASVPLGTKLKFICKIEPLVGDTTPDDNVDTAEVIVTNAFDPNVKVVSPDAANHVLPLNTKQFDYVIHFQNTGTDTAINIVVADTLDAELAISSVTVDEASHPFTVKLDDRVLTFTFANIMLPDSNHNEPASHGFVSYHVKPKSQPVEGTRITNTAYIYFDFNTPVVTNTTISILSDVQNSVAVPVQKTKNGMWIYPNPASGKTRIDLSESLPHATLQLYTVMGQKVLEKNFSGGRYELNCAQLPAGIYILKVTDESAGFQSVQRFMLK